MGFVLSKKPTFRYAVKVRQPRDTGKHEAFEFTGEFKRMDQPAIDAARTKHAAAVIGLLRGMDSPEEQMKKKRAADRELVDTVFVGWFDVKALVKEGEVEVEKDLPVTPENRAVLLAEPGVEEAVVTAWHDATSNGPAKN